MQLYGTETLYGDWGGQVLLLAKDWGPSSILRKRIEAGDLRPWRHEPTMQTNVNLRRLAGPHEHLGLLYGSALANLLRDDGQVSGALPNRREALEYGVEVLRFVLDNMPALRWVLCMGLEAWECACRALDVEGDWRAHRDSGEPLGHLVAGFHPAARVARKRMAAPWEVLGRGAAVG